MINLMLFSVTFLTVPQSFLYYIFIIVSFSNMLFIYSRIISRTDAYILLRQLGSSFIFIIFDNIFEIILVFVPAAAFSLIFSLYIRPSALSFLFILFQALVVVLFIPIVSLIVLIRLDKQIREE